jgi:hypothetical protein
VIISEDDNGKMKKEVKQTVIVCLLMATCHQIRQSWVAEAVADAVSQQSTDILRIYGLEQCGSFSAEF